MRIYVQSKTGNYNAVLNVDPPMSTLVQAFEQLRAQGGYKVTHRKTEVEYVIPFEEIEFIREATEDER